MAIDLLTDLIDLYTTGDAATRAGAARMLGEINPFLPTMHVVKALNFLLTRYICFGLFVVACVVVVAGVDV